MAAETRSQQAAVARARPKRYVSHALVEVRRFRWMPIFCQSAVLLDISAQGFKLEFTGETSVLPGSQHWLSIPLAPLGITSPARFTCRCECKWFDSSRFRMGGTLVGLSTQDQQLVQSIVASLKTRGQL